MVRHPLLDELVGAEVWVKLENTTTIGAFKLRGALNLMATLSEVHRRSGICAPTRGNHGQALAYASAREGVRCVLFVPKGNNPDKNRAMEAFGAELRVAGETFDEAHRAAVAFAEDTGAHYVHPGRTPELIAGAGTIGLEMFDAVEGTLDDIFAPVGVGSLAAGLGLAAAAASPRTRIWGVSALSAPAMHDAFYDGLDRPKPVGRTVADGLAVGEPVSMTLEMMRRYLAGMTLVTEGELRNSMRVLARTVHQMAEGAGAAGLAGAMQMRDQLRGKRVGVVLSGGNVDAQTLRQLLDEGSEPAEVVRHEARRGSLVTKR